MSYYHAFVPGFNSWYIAALLAIIVALAYARLSVWTKSGKIRHLSERVDKVLCGVLVAPICVMMGVESYWGLAQLWLNATRAVFGFDLGAFCSFFILPLVSILMAAFGIGYLYYKAIGLVRQKAIASIRARRRKL